MTSRLIEKCFESEEYEGTYFSYPVFIIDMKEIEESLISMMTSLLVPGKLIRVKSLSAVKNITYKEITYDNH